MQTNLHSGCDWQQVNQQMNERAREVCELEMQQKGATALIEQYEREYRRAESERDLLGSQLDKLEKELEQVHQAVAGDRQMSEKLVRENQMLHKQLSEHMSNIH